MSGVPAPERLRHADTFVITLFRTTEDALRGLVQHVRTGEKTRFDGLDGLGRAIGRMRSREREEPGPGR